MADLSGINGNSELVFKLKLKTEINSGESLDKIADEKIREYFKQNVECSKIHHNEHDFLSANHYTPYITFVSQMKSTLVCLPR